MRARASFTRHQVDRAYVEAQHALAVDKSHRVAAAVLIDTAPATVSPAELELAVSDALHHLDVCVAMSRRFAIAGQHEEALRLARGIEVSQENWTRSIAIGEAILSRFEENYGLRIGAPKVATSRTFSQRRCNALNGHGQP